MTDAEVEIWKAIIQGSGTVVAACIIGLVGTIIAKRYARERDRQDKESEWRSHAIELTKLEFDRLKYTRNQDDPSLRRPITADFLAVYRDLSELDFSYNPSNKFTPKELYNKIMKERTSHPKESNNSASRTKKGEILATCGGEEGHPIVWLKIGRSDSINCPYCSAKFVLVAEIGEEQQEI